MAISVPAGAPGTTSGPASPYPSTVVVSGLLGTVNNVTVRLNNLSHTFPDDVDILLVGPGGQNAIIMSDVGGSLDAVDVSLTLDDLAAMALPDATQLVSGTFQPTNIGTGDTFPAPAPSPSGGSALSVFTGTNPNGVWSLYVVDDLGGDVGAFANGWGLTIRTAGCVGTEESPSNASNEAILGTGNQPSVVDSLMSSTMMKFRSGTIY